MKISVVIIAFVLAVGAAPAAEDEIKARVIDGKSDRIPAHTVVPRYPQKARRDRVEGQVMVCFEIDREGRPRRIAVRNSTHRAFERPSIIAVRTSLFRPLGKQEALPAIKSCRTFVFSLVPVDDSDA